MTLNTTGIKVRFYANMVNSTSIGWTVNQTSPTEGLKWLVVVKALDNFNLIFSKFFERPGSSKKILVNPQNKVQGFS